MKAKTTAQVCAVIMAWAASAQTQTPTFTERPVNLRLYPRAPGGGCTVPVKGSVAAGADKVTLNVYGGKAKAQYSAQPAQGKFSLEAPLEAAMAQYRFELVTAANGSETATPLADSVLCGDAYIIYGQSNAEALYGSGAYTFRSPWIRTYRDRWQTAEAGGGASHIGVWGQHLARLLTERQHIPICMLNPALGNTSLKELSPGYVSPAGDPITGEVGKWGSLYARMKGWAADAGLANGVRAMLWHQGEKQVYGNDYADYYHPFLGLRKAVYADVPGIKDIFLFQIKTGCGGGSLGWSKVFEDQRRLAMDFEDLRIMTTLAPDLVGCHLGEENRTGYQTAAEWLYPLLDARFYGGIYDKPITPPNLLQAAYTSARKDEIVLRFDQEMKWTDSCVYDPKNPAQTCEKPKPNFSRDLFGFDSLVLGQVASGRSEGDRVFLKLKKASAYKKIAYPHGNLSGCWSCPFLTGNKNGLGALGFYVNIADTPSTVSALAAGVASQLRMALVHSRGGDNLEFSLPVSVPDLGVQVHDFSGRLIRSRRIGQSAAGIRRTVPIGDLPPGAYFVRLQGGGQAWCRSLWAGRD